MKRSAGRRSPLRAAEDDASEEVPAAVAQGNGREGGEDR